MNFLIIETSSEKSFIALCNAGKLSKVYFLSYQKQSTALLPSLQELLSEHHLTLDDMSFIAIGKGPGSFTGTRIGVMTAKAFNFSRVIPLVPFCSLECFSPPFNGHFTLLVDALSHGFYVLQGKKDEESLCFFEGPRLVKTKEVSSFLKPSTCLLSPHPDCIVQKLPQISHPILAAEINFGLLAKRLCNDFKKGLTCHHTHLTVSYLNSP